MSSSQLKEKVKSLAIEAGFVRAGIAPAGTIEPQASRALREWLESGMHASLEYMARNFARRLEPRKLVPGSTCVICLAISYAPPPAARNYDAHRGPRPFVARYARGRDYHRLLKKRCASLMGAIRKLVPLLQGRAFVDGAPVAERALAARAGLGFIGKNGSLIVPDLGSYVLLCEIVCNLPLEPDEPLKDNCGDCDLCVRACPTGAIGPERLVDAHKCISYQTIENVAPIPFDLREKIGVRVFGCDSCQEACPHNRAVPTGDAELAGDCPLGGAVLAEILRWEPRDWDAATRGKATRRAKFETLLRNAVIASGNSAETSLLAGLRELADKRPEFRRDLHWAMERLEQASRNHL